MITSWSSNLIPFLGVLRDFLLGDGIFPFIGLFLFIWVVRLFLQFLHMKVF